MSKSKKKMLTAAGFQHDLGACSKSTGNSKSQKVRLNGKIVKKCTNQIKYKKKMLKTSSAVSSSSMSIKDSTRGAPIEGDSLSNAGAKIKVQCDLCKLSYCTEKELREHSLSLMHHTKLEDKEENPVHKCTLCDITCSNMAEYRNHIALDSHQKKLAYFKNDSRDESQRSERNSRWNERPDHRYHSEFDNRNSKSGLSDSGLWTNRSPVPFRVHRQYKVYSERFDPNMPITNQNQRKQHKRFGCFNPAFSWRRDDAARNKRGKDHRRQLWNHLENNIDSETDQDRTQLESWGSGAYSRNNTYGYQLGEERNRGHFKDSHFIDFTKDDSFTYWDDFSITEQEQFLAGMDDMYPNNRTNVHKRTTFRYEQENMPVSNYGTRTDDMTARDRKRPRNEDDVEESVAKSSRSVDCSSDENIPVRSVAGKLISAHVTPAVGQAMLSSFSPNADISSSQAAIDNASDNILERAERLCRELRQKREASQAHRNTMLKIQQRDFLNQKIEAVAVKQKSYLKGHIKASKTEQEKDRSALASQSKCSTSSAKSYSRKLQEGSISHLSKVASRENNLDIRNSIQKNVLGEEEKSGASRVTTPVTKKIKQRSSSGGDMGRPISIAVSKPQLSKDSLKKMVNAVRSRDERLQLAKMLHSREEHKSTPTCTPRTNLQLEGLLDSATAADVSTETINLEDLSESVRQQILDLIDDDFLSNVESHSEPELHQENATVPHTNSARSFVQSDVINLLDDEEDKSKRPSKKNKPQLSEKSALKPNSEKKSDDCVRVKKKKKPQPYSSPGKNSSTKPGTYLETSKPQKSSLERKSRPTTKVKNTVGQHQRFYTESVCNDIEIVENTVGKDQDGKTSTFIDSADSDIEVVSCSSGIDTGKDITNPSKSVMANTVSPNCLRAVSNYKPSYSCSNQTPLTTANVREKFPTLMDFPKIPLLGEVNRSSDAGYSSQVVDISSSALESRPAVISSLQLKSSLPIPQSTLTASLQENTSSPLSQGARRLTLPPSTWLADRHSSCTFQDDRVSTVGGSFNEAEAESDDTKALKHFIITKVSSSSTLYLSPEKDLSNLEINGQQSNKSNNVTTVPTLTITTQSRTLESDSSKGKTQNVFTSAPTMASPAVGQTSDQTGNSQHNQEQHMTVVLSNDKTSSQAMSELLVLSEREEEVKQEMMSMELRLTRLHRLLEQAVVQINKCTGRRNQLLQEEQDLSQRRLQLLRASSRISMRSGASDTTDLPAHDTPLPSRSNQVSQTTATTLKSITLEESNNAPNMTLSKADWLAKFSSYLPLDPVSDNNKLSKATSSCSEAPAQQSASTNSSTVTTNESSKRQIVKVRDKGSYNDDQQHLEKSNTSQMGGEDQASNYSNDGSMAASVSTYLANVGSTASSMFSSPVMYVGSFRSSPATLQLTAPVLLLNTDVSEASKSMTKQQLVSRSRRDSIPMVLSVSDNTQDSFADLLSLPNRSRPAGCGGEESDIGSVASSYASGSSLGEKISHYCRTTPGASLGHMEHCETPELSVIMSDTSEPLRCDSHQEGEKEDTNIRKENWDRIIRPCFVQLERLKTQPRKDVYGNLDKDAVRSAEALHLMERNHEDQGQIGQDNSKRKKRKTRQERDAIGFRRRRQRCIRSSSSDGETKEYGQEEDTAVTCRQKGKDGSADCSSNVTSKECTNNLQLSPSGNIDVTVAECDSSTNLELVDSESITNQARTMMEIRDSFLRNFAPALTSLLPQGNFTQAIPTSSNAATRIGSLAPTSERLSTSVQSSKSTVIETPATHMSVSADSQKTVHSDTDVKPGFDFAFKKINSLLPSPKSLEQKSSLSSLSNSKSRQNVMMCRFPSGFGPVVNICVEKNRLYVGHINYGIRVHDVNRAPHDSVVGMHSFPDLQCMCTAKLNKRLTIIVGNGSELVFSHVNEDKRLSYDMGATVKCLLLMLPLIYAGLDTGQIGLFESKTMVLKEKFMCSDHPIHCLAQSQEGATRLLCASSQDGTIIIMEAHSCLPIRILTGHSKTAFSIQTDGLYLYSGSGDGSVLVHNIHTATIKHACRDNIGLVKSVFCYKGFLFTGGMDRLVRCYNTKTHELVQVYFGAERGVITKVIVHDNKIITGNTSGSVDIVELSPLEASHRCLQKGCTYNFGNQSHLFWHLLEDHNISQKPSAVLDYYSPQAAT